MKFIMQFHCVFKNLHKELNNLLSLNVNEIVLYINENKQTPFSRILEITMYSYVHKLVPLQFYA